MEDVLKTDFSPMLTFGNTDSIEVNSGFYYQSIESSPTMRPHSFESSPSQSPQFYGSYDSSPQYYLESNLNQSPPNQYQIQFQSQSQAPEFIVSEHKKFSCSNFQNGGIMLEPVKPPTQASQIPSFNELSQLFNMANKMEDKMAIQAKIKQILFEQLNKPQAVHSSFEDDSIGQQTTMITPPLSPNGENMQYMSKQTPSRFAKSGQPTFMPTNQLIKVEPLSPIRVQQQPQPITRTTSRTSFIESTNGSNVENSLVGVQSPIAITSSTIAPNNCSPRTVYFQSPATQPLQYDQYKMDPSAAASFPSTVSILVSETSPIPDAVPFDDSKLNSEFKTIAAAKPKTKSKSKTRSKKSSESKILPVVGGNPKQSQKRSAHLSAEFRYRTKLNDKISKLRSLVGQKVHLSKSAVLTRSIERIIKLQKLTIRLHDSNLKLQSLLSKYTNSLSPIPSATNGNPLMSIKELTRSLSSSSSASSNQSLVSNQTIDIDLAKFIDSQMLIEPEPIPVTIEQPLNGPVANNSLNVSPTDEVFDFDQFLAQF